MGGCWGSAADELSVLPTNTREPVVTVRWLSGTPAILKTNRWISLQVGEVIPAGANIRTGAGENLEMVLDEPGHLLAIGPESAATIDLRIATVSLEAGELIASIRKTRKDNTSVIIHSRFGETTVRAADLRITINPAPTLAVLSGAVFFAPARGGAEGGSEITAGSLITATADRPEMEPINYSMSGYLIGRIDALVSFYGILAQRFSPSDDPMLCHIPPRPRLSDPEPRPARIGRFGYGNEDQGPLIGFASVVSDFTVQSTQGSMSCPVHTRAPRTAPPKTRPQVIPPPVRRASLTNAQPFEVPDSKKSAPPAP